jgi:sugar lactone lactonase YvrE
MYPYRTLLPVLALVLILAAPGLAASQEASPPAGAAIDAPVAFVWSRTGDAAHTLAGTPAVAIDPLGRIWAVSVPSTYFIFDAEGTLIETWGTSGDGDGQFNFNGEEVACGAILWRTDGGFYVSDCGNYRIQQFDTDRHFVRAWGTKGSGEGQFLSPLGLAFDDAGNLLVSDYHRHDVQSFTPEGDYVDTFGGEGGQRYGFVAVAPDGTIWVPDPLTHEVKVFGPDRSLRFSFGKPGAFDLGGGNGKLEAPLQVAFDAAGHAFVVDGHSGLIQVFDLQGRFLYQFGGKGFDDGEFLFPHSVAVDQAGTSIYVADLENRRIQKFAIVGPFPPPAEATPVP